MTTPPGAAGGAPDSAFRTHGMGKTLVEPDWPPLTGEEVGAVLAAYGRPGGAVAIRWRRHQPMSAAALASLRGEEVFVKRHHVLVRSPAQLAAEHAFAAHLRALGVAVPAVLRLPDGTTTVRSGDYVYEVHDRAEGIDLYRDAVSWSPFTSAAHARAAGAALARFHLASTSFGLPERPPGVLMNSCAVIAAADPLAAVARLAARRPGLAGYLDRRRWRDDLTRHHLPAIGRLAPLLPALGRLWGHGDWHPSNLTWTAPSPDAGVAAWLDLADTGRAAADIPAVDALLDGYRAVRRLSQAELAALAPLLPVVHVEYALSEVEYFASVVRAPENADLAYDGYLIGHARWFTGPEGTALLSHLRQRAGRRPAAP